MVDMKKRVTAAVIALSIAADLSEMHCCECCTSLLEDHLDELKSRIDAYIDYLAEVICGIREHLPSTLSFGDQPILT